jgi:hypothetical protein
MFLVTADYVLGPLHLGNRLVLHLSQKIGVPAIERLESLVKELNTAA